MKARVGMVSQWYDPERGSAAQPGVIARHLHEVGHTVDVVTGVPNYPSGQIYEGYRLRPYQREQRAGVSVHRAPLYPSHDTQPVRRSLTYLSFAAAASVVSARALRHAQSVLVYSSPATTAVPAMLLRALRGIPYVVHVHDLWPDSVLLSGFLSRRPGVVVGRALHAYCDLVYRYAAAVAVTSPGMAAEIQARGVPRSKIHFIPNWADEEVFRPLPADPDLRVRLGLQPGAVAVMYAGNVGPYQDLSTVVDAAALLRHRSDVQFVLVGDGVERVALEERCRREGLDNVLFAGARTVQEMPALLALGDLHLVTLRDLPLFRMTLPSKLVATLSSGRPVLAALTGDGAALVSASGAGEVVSPGRPDELAAAVVRFAALDQGERDRLGAAGRSYYLDNLGREHVGRVLSELLDEVAETRRLTARGVA